MKRMLGVIALLSGGALADGFEFVTAERVTPIAVAPGEPECVRLAAEDLASDVQRITGRKPKVITTGEVPQGACVTIGTKSGGLWESYRVEAKEGRLVIEGGDVRGTMFGVYAFVEEYLKVDPLSFWSGREPAKRAGLHWDKIALISGPPTFKFRGWFINDEDLLTFWKPGGERILPYKFYSNIMHRDVLRAVAEALVRCRCNLVIPASFIDILNPVEEALVKECARRGLFLSMHHQEPLGVSAWVYFNYWKVRGKDLKYSYVSHPEEVREVWRVYAKRWAEYPNVIWQLGLRGKGDTPMWQADASTPQSDADRGRIISEAMAAQVKILDEVCPQQPRVMSTTLWAEGAVLNQKGLLTVPEGTIIVFADNSPGWKWQRDFYETPRSPKNTYGVYYHHALIGCGPHLAQAVPPHKTFVMLQEALSSGAGEYAIFNVSNVREFILGIDATASMTWRMEGYEPDRWLDAWVKDRFSVKRAEIVDAYKIFFNAYQIHDVQKVPFLLDGQMLHSGSSVLAQISSKLTAKRVGAGTEPEMIAYGATNRVEAKETDAFWAGLSDAFPKPLGRRETVKRITAQRLGFELAGLHARAAVVGLQKEEAAFLADNLIYPCEIMQQMSAWLEDLLVAQEALDLGDLPACVRSLEEARKAFEKIPKLAEGYCAGKWKDWYQGCRILNVSQALKKTGDVLTLAKECRDRGRQTGGKTK